MKKKILIVDGYNMVAFWDETKQLFKQNRLHEARNILLQKLSNYAGFEKLEITVVFDANYMPGVRQQYDHYNLTVIFTEEDETADSYIERMAAELNDGLHLVSVATSDLNEQWTVFAQGALRVSARELEERVSTVKSDLKKMSTNINLHTPRLGPWSDDQLANLKAMMEDIE
jgi:predicted RNA-binding protein with PIN domain